MPTMLEQINKIVGQPVTPTRLGIESYMSKRQEEGHWMFWADRQIIAQFSLVCMPGCCGIVISTGASVIAKYQGKGIGKIMHRMRLEIAERMGYSLLLCTDVRTNVPQQRILGYFGWHKLLDFKNARTENTVNLHSYDLNQYRTNKDNFGVTIDLGFDPFKWGRQSVDVAER